MIPPVYRESVKATAHTLPFTALSDDIPSLQKTLKNIEDVSPVYWYSNAHPSTVLTSNKALEQVTG